MRLWAPVWIFIGCCEIGLWASPGAGQSPIPASSAGPHDPVDQLARQAREHGDARRGAVVFFKSVASCSKCHDDGTGATTGLGPALTALGTETTERQVAESILYPSRSIKPEHATVAVLSSDGRLNRGLKVRENATEFVLRDAEDLEREIVILKAEIESRLTSEVSMMPSGLADTFARPGDLQDLIAYVTAVARGGTDRAARLRPSVEQLRVRDDTQNLDHAGILGALGPADLIRGRAIYRGHCANCHGSDGRTPALATARAFGTEPLKFGDDPLAMLTTLTRGNGLMSPMKHLSPKERYQVIHYIRTEFLRGGGASLKPIDADYLAGLPRGTDSGEFVIGDERDFGPVLGSQLGQRINSSLSFRLATNVTLNYDLHRFELGGVWQGGFLDLSQTHHYRQRGEGMPEPAGVPVPGMSDYRWELGGGFERTPEQKPERGPVDARLAKFHGYYLHDQQCALSYRIGDREVLEAITSEAGDESVSIHHTFRVGAGGQALRLCVGRRTTRGESDLPVFKKSEKLVWIPVGPREEEKSRGDTGGEDPPVIRRGVAVGLRGETNSLAMAWEGDRLVLTILPSDEAKVFRVTRTGVDAKRAEALETAMTARDDVALPDPAMLTRGGPARWPQELTTAGALGKPINGYTLDTVAVPFENPWNAWMRTSSLDFFPDGRAVVTTHGGDVYLVRGLDAELTKVTWKRFAAGLFEPFGCRVVDGTIYVTCRDGIKRLHDYDGNDEADFVESFWTDDDVSNRFHAYNFGLQTDADGNFLLAKAGQYTRHRRPGAIMRIPPEGGRADVVAWGLRTPNGLGLLGDGRLTVSDNQGPWMPAGKISVVKPGRFYGNMPINAEQDQWLRRRHGGRLPSDFEPPVIWTPQELDSSCGGQVWAGDERWGPLSGRLIHSSFGKGRLYYLSLQETHSGDATGETQAVASPGLQGAIVALRHQWDAGVMRLRVNPADGQLYGTGLSGWQGPPSGSDGCLQRLRYSGGPVRMIERVKVTRAGITLRFSFPLAADSTDTDAWALEMWDYLWSKKYGSDQFSVKKPGAIGRDRLAVASVIRAPDEHEVTLVVPELATCDQLRIAMNLRDADGRPFDEEVHLTINAIAAE